MRVHESYNKIEKVIEKAGKALAPHEFENVTLENPDPKFPRLGIDSQINGRSFVGQSESAIGRRLREMRELGRVTSQRREGTAFVEYALVKKAPAVAPCPEPEVEQPAAHSGGY